MQNSVFELLELPDGRCCVARPATCNEATLIAGSFARIERADTAATTPVGVYASRSEAEIAIQRAAPSPSPGDPLDIFAAWRHPR